MAIQNIKVKFNGISPLLQNNPQMVDPFNKYSKLIKPIMSKRKKTDEQIQQIRDLEVEAKLFFDEEIGIYVPARWVLSSIAQNAFSIAKVAKAKTRGAIFAINEKCKLTYDGMNAVKSKTDIVKNSTFTTNLILPQRGVRIAKSFPIFHKWSFEIELEYDDLIMDKAELVSILEYGAKYGGFGDFRPSYGRALCEVINV